MGRGMLQSAAKLHLSTQPLPNISWAQSMPFAPTPAEVAIVNQIFVQADPQKLGLVTGEQGVKVFAGAKLPPATLGDIWAIADPENNGALTRKGVAIAVRLIGWAQNGETPSSELLEKGISGFTIDLFPLECP